MIMFNPTPLLIGALLLSVVIAVLPTIIFAVSVFLIIKSSGYSDLNINRVNNEIVLFYIISIICCTVLTYKLNVHAEYLNQYAEKYGQIYYVKVNGNEIYSTDLQMSGEHIIVNDVNGNYCEIDKNQDNYKIEYKKYTQNKE